MTTLDVLVVAVQMAQEKTLDTSPAKHQSEGTWPRWTYMSGKALTWHDVLVDDLHVVVAVGAGVLVPETNHVPELVHHDAELVAVLADGDGLRAVPPLPDETAATGSI